MIIDPSNFLGLLRNSRPEIWDWNFIGGSGWCSLVEQGREKCDSCDPAWSLGSFSCTNWLWYSGPVSRGCERHYFAVDLFPPQAVSILLQVSITSKSLPEEFAFNRNMQKNSPNPNQGSKNQISVVSHLEVRGSRFLKQTEFIGILQKRSDIVSSKEKVDQSCCLNQLSLTKRFTPLLGKYPHGSFYSPLYWLCMGARRYYIILIWLLQLSWWCMYLISLMWFLGLVSPETFHRLS